MLLRRQPPLLPNVHHRQARLCVSSEPSAAPPNSSDPWIAKVVSTVFLLSPSRAVAAARLAVFREALLTPSVAVLTLRRLGNRRSPIEYFEAAQSSFRGDCSVAAAAYLAVIEMLCQSRLKDSALELFDRMRKEGHPVDSGVLGCLVNSLAQAGELDAAMGLLSRASEFGCGVRASVCNNLLSLFIAKNCAREAIDFFSRQLGSQYFTPDTCSFNIIIKGLFKMGDIDKALQYINDMSRFGCLPDAFTHSILIDGLCKANQVERGHEVLRGMHSNRLCSPSVITYTSIISGYCKMGKMMEACGVFDEMVSFGIRPNQVTYNTVINGFGKAGDMSSAVSTYENMVVRGCSPDVVTFTSLIDGYCRIGQVDDALKTWHKMCEKNVSPNVYTFAAVVNALCKVNRISEARDLLTVLKGRADVVAQPFMYNPVIDGFCRAGNVDEANLILREMEESRCFPDKVTYTILIIGHCMKGRMSEAIALFNKMGTRGCASDSITVNSLISCLLKAGMPNEANRIMVSMSQKNLERDLSSSRKTQYSLRKSFGVTAVA